MKNSKMTETLYKQPHLRSQAHCQVAQKAYRTDVNLSISLSSLTRKRNAQLLTKAICNAGSRVESCGILLFKVRQIADLVK